MKKAKAKVAVDAALMAKVKAAATDGKLPCAAALKLAAALGVTAGKIGAAADEAGVRIARCQLGCFE